MLFNATSGEECEKISCCETAKKIKDKLEATYEGTEKVKKILVSLFVYNDELIKMKDRDSIEEIFSKFRKIVGELKDAGKTYPVSYQFTKILRSLPPQWLSSLWLLKV